MNPKLQAIIDAFKSDIIGEGDLGPLLGQIESRQKQARYDAVDKATAEGIDVVQAIEEKKRK